MVTHRHRSFPSSAPAASGPDEIRASTAYRGGRQMFVMPFWLLGILGAVSSAVLLVLGLMDLLVGRSGQAVGYLIFGMWSLLGGLLLIGIASLAEAVFDFVDCQISRELRARDIARKATVKETARAHMMPGH